MIKATRAESCVICNGPGSVLQGEPRHAACVSCSLIHSRNLLTILWLARKVGSFHVLLYKNSRCHYQQAEEQTARKTLTMHLCLHKVLGSVMDAIDFSSAHSAHGSLYLYLVSEGGWHGMASAPPSPALQ